MKKEYTTINISRDDKDIFDKLNSDWNLLNKEDRKNKEEFFSMMLIKFRDLLKNKK